MLKALRKYRQWILVIGGALLMLAFLAGPTIQQLSGDPGKRKWATLDGRTLRLKDQQLASQELEALEDVTFGVWPAELGVERGRGDVKHWLLLTHEARQAGYLAEAQEPEWLPELLGQARLMSQFQGIDIRALIRQNPSLAQTFSRQLQEFVEQARTAAPDIIARVANENRMTPEQLRGALSKARGVLRMYQAYQDAARVSDRATATEGRRLLDAAWVDYVVVPASVGAAAIPEPDDAALTAHFDRFKATKPGEGDYGIGYLMPDRIKVEWLELDAPAIEAAITLDPIELNQRHLRDRTRYPGDFATERTRVEQDLKAERVARVMDEAHRVLQAEVLKVTRKLETEGPYKRLPPDWAEQRPKFEAVAPRIVEGVREATGITIPLPTVVVRAAEWLTRQDLSAVPGIGNASFRSGAVEAAAGDVLFAVRELRGDSAPDDRMHLSIQSGVPLIESFFTDYRRSRYYATILDARKESAPDSFAEIRAKVVEDFRNLRSYEQLTGRVEEFRSLAVAEGLQKVVDTTKPAGEPPAGQDVALTPAPALRTRVRVVRENAESYHPDRDDFNTDPVRTAIMEAAGRLDPLTPPEQFDPSAATVAVAVPMRRAVVVARIIALEPLTRELYRLSEPNLAARRRQDELFPGGAPTTVRPFALDSLQARHSFVVRDGEEEPEEPDPAAPAKAASTGG